jgi:hypothetical protein
MDGQFLRKKLTRFVSLTNLNWNIIPYQIGLDNSTLLAHAVEEFPTSNGPADYAFLFPENY